MFIVVLFKYVFLQWQSKSTLKTSATRCLSIDKKKYIYKFLDLEPDLNLHHLKKNLTQWTILWVTFKNNYFFLHFDIPALLCQIGSFQLPQPFIDFKMNNILSIINFTYFCISLNFTCQSKYARLLAVFFL